MASKNAGQASLSGTGKTQPSKKAIGIDPSKIQFDDLRIGTLNCQSQNAEKQKSILEYCVMSGCDIVALQETGTIFDACKDSRIKTFAKTFESDDQNEDYGMKFFIKDPNGIRVKGEHVHPRIVILRFKYKNVEFKLLNVYGVVPSHDSSDKADQLFAELQQRLQTIQQEEKNRIVIACGDMNAFPMFATFGIYSPWIENHAYGTWNKHGVLFFDFLQSTEMNHLNSRFKKPKGRKWTRRGYEGQSNTEIDGFLCARTDIVQDVDSFIGAAQVRVVVEGVRRV